MQYFTSTRHQLSEAIARKDTKKAMYMLRDLFDTMAEVMKAKDTSNFNLQCHYSQVAQRLVDAERYWQRAEMDTNAKHSALRDESFAKIEALREEVSKLGVLLKQQQHLAEADKDSFITTITKGMAKQAVTVAMLEGSKRQVAELSAKVEDMEAREAAREEAAAAREKALAIQVATLMAENDKLRAAVKTAVTEGDKGLKACGGDGKDDISSITTTTKQVQQEDDNEAAPPAISTAKPSPAAAAEAPSTPVLGESYGASGGASKVPSAAAVKAAQAASLAVSGLIRRPSSGGSSGRSSPSAAPSHTYGTNTNTTHNNNSNQSNKGGRRRNSSGKSKNHSGRPNHNHNHSYGSGFSQGMGASYQGGRHSSGGGSYGSFNSNTSSGADGGCYRGYEGKTARGSHSYTEGYTTNNTNRCHSHPHSNYYGSTNQAQRGGYGHNTTGRRIGPSGGAYTSPYSSY